MKKLYPNIKTDLLKYSKIKNKDENKHEKPAIVFPLENTYI
jgi:hypothetical protein